MKQLHSLDIVDGKARLRLTQAGTTTLDRLNKLLTDVKVAAQCGRPDVQQLCDQCQQAIDQLAKHLEQKPSDATQ